MFLHGWGLANRTYRQALTRLVAGGLRVYAPTLLGFGDNAAMTTAELSLTGYGHWIADFIRTVEGPPPVALIGHSFGGGVALRTAHDHEGLVGRLVLVNSIGGSVRHVGLRTSLGLLPHADRPWLVACLHVLGRAEPKHAVDSRYTAIFRRHSYRAPFGTGPVEPALREAFTSERSIAQDVDVWGVRLRTVESAGELSSLARLLTYAGPVRHADNAYQRELVAWSGTALAGFRRRRWTRRRGQDSFEGPPLTRRTHADRTAAPRARAVGAHGR